MRESKFFVQLFAAIMVFVVVYTFIASGIFYYKNNELVNHDLDNAQRQLVEQAEEKLDTYLLVATNLIYQLRTNDHMNDYVKSGGADPYAVTKLHLDLIDMVGAFADFGYMIGITNKDGSVVITPEHTIDKERYYQEIGLTHDEILIVKNHLESSRTGAFLTVPKHPGAEVERRNTALTLVRKEKIGENGEFIVFVNFPEKQFSLQLSSSETEAFGIVNGNGLVSMQSDLDRAKLEGLMVPFIREGGMENHEYFRTESGRYFIHAVPSKVMRDWRYVYLVPKNKMDKSTRNLLMESLLVYMALGIWGAGLAYMFSRRMYRPVRNLVRSFKGIDIDSEARDEFAFVQEAASRIHTANANLREMMSAHRAPLKINFIRDLLWGMVPDHRLQEELEKHGLEAFNGHLTVVIVEFANYKELEEEYSKELILKLKPQIAIILEEQLRQQTETEVVEITYKGFVLLLRETDPSVLKKMLDGALKTIEASMEFPMVAAIGSPSENLPEIEKSYQSALQIMDYWYSIHNQTILTWTDLEDTIQESFFYPLDLESSFIHYLLRGKEKEAENLLNRVLEENFVKRKLSDEVLSQFHYAIITTVNRVVHQLGQMPVEFFGDEISLYAEFKMVPVRTEMPDRIRKLFFWMLGRIKGKDDRMDNAQVSRIIEFIAENYAADLSLQYLAEHFGLSAGYIGTLFKSHTGENFRDYLNICRVTKAKEILSQEDVKINDLALRVGCTNSHTFIRMFKKYEGVSPGQYLKDRDGHAE
ncbi:helix-turn-helix domain-containing protein [Paenibacillus sp. LjRoot56]|uniref:helix-turn-helix domain-containing protein n=1 Tax=Paenibacillus sp. LjRoot56 TaxID=3342333 RepID=UPI003ECE6375